MSHEEIEARLRALFIYVDSGKKIEVSAKEFTYLLGLLFDEVARLENEARNLNQKMRFVEYENARLRAVVEAVQVLYSLAYWIPIGMPVDGWPMTDRQKQIAAHPPTIERAFEAWVVVDKVLRAFAALDQEKKT